jgi:hypothetical protein
LFAHGKGLPHGKGTFAVAVFFAVRCRQPLPCFVLCRALDSFFAVLLFVAVRSATSLPCASRCRALYGAFAVLHFVAVHCISVAR